MDSTDFDNVKAEKAKALRRFNRFRSIGRLFRAAELCVALLFLCWTFTRLPFAVQISGVFLRRIAAVISTPLFVFLLGNSIVVVLLTKSSDHKTVGAAETELYQAFVRSVENRPKPPSDEEQSTTVYVDKEMIVTDLNTNSSSNPKLDENIPQDVENDSDTTSVLLSEQPCKKVYRRSKSDVVSAKQSNSPDMSMTMMKRSLQRSETEKYCTREIESIVESEEDENCPEDHLSNEEFQKTIEAFIAKQLMFRRQESLAVVVHTN